MSECKGCGTKLKNCGAPIWEDYCPNKKCNYEAEQFKASMRKTGEEMRKKKALEAAAPELYEAVEWLEYYAKVQVDSHPMAADSIGWNKVLSSLAKARGE